MVRQIIALAFCVVLIVAVSSTAQAEADIMPIAENYTAYNGSISESVVNTFKDIARGIDLGEHYVLFRARDNTYIMVTGDLTYDGYYHFSGSTVTYYYYRLSTYDEEHHYNSYAGTDFVLYTNQSIVYSDLGRYPRLIERGSQYEIITAVLVCTGLLGVVIGRIFRRR